MNEQLINEVVEVWKAYLDTVTDWETLTKGIMPKDTDCGPVYEIPNPIDRPNESFAIADMRNLKITGPHYHTGGETEIYFALSGSGRLFIGGEEIELKPGVVSVTPQDTVHFTIPTENLVLAVINTPPFNPEHTVSVTASDPKHKFDAEQFEYLKSI